MTPPGSAGTDRDLLALLVPTVAEAGYDLEDLEVAQAGRRRRIRLAIDKDGGVTLDECAEVSRLVDEALEASEELGEDPYVLEVSSPGVSRPLTLPRHWRRNVGRLVAVTPRRGDAVTGRVLEADDDGALLEAADGRRRVAYADVVTARVQVEFDRAGRDGDEPGEG